MQVRSELAAVAEVPQDGTCGQALSGRDRRREPREAQREPVGGEDEVVRGGVSDQRGQRSADFAALRREHVDAEMHRRGLGARTLAGGVPARLAVGTDRTGSSGGIERSRREIDRLAGRDAGKRPGAGGHAWGE